MLPDYEFQHKPLFDGTCYVVAEGMKTVLEQIAYVVALHIQTKHATSIIPLWLQWTDGKRQMWWIW